MKSPRLLPIVIFATLALLVFKGIGIVTEGGYVLAGAGTAKAAEGGEAAPSVDNAAPRTEPTMSDTSPTLTDSAPTLVAPAAAHGAGAPPPAAATAHDAAAPAAAASAASPDPHPPAAAPTAAGPADALAMTIDNNGQKVPLSAADGSSLTQQELLQRLAERRAELDKRQTALDMREAIVAAAEKQMASRAEALKSLEAQIAALTNQKQAMQDDQFSGLVKMYETMKPQEAASIFDGLDIGVLVRVAKAMDARKMSPILAKMASARAQELTMQLAADDTQPAPTVSSIAPDPNSLPQIVGH